MTTVDRLGGSTRERVTAARSERAKKFFDEVDQRYYAAITNIATELNNHDIDALLARIEDVSFPVDRQSLNNAEQERLFKELMKALAICPHDL